MSEGIWRGSTSASEATGRDTGRLLLLAIVALVALVRLPSFFHQLYDPDEAAIAAQAIALRHDGTLYVDAIDRKPPLPPYLYEASFRLTGSTDLRPLHVLAALGLAGAAAVLALDVRRRHGEVAGWWAAGLFVAGAVGFTPATAQAANYAHLAIVPGALAVVLARRGTWWSPPVAGVVLGLAVLSRQTWILGVPAGLVGVALAAPGRVRTKALAVAAFAAGLAAVIAAVGLVAPFSDFQRWTFTGNERFLSAQTSILPAFGRLSATVGIFIGFHLTMVAALFALAWTSGRRWRDHVGDLDLWLWLGAGLVSVLAGFRFFGHYWLQVVPAAAILAAPVVARLTGRWRQLAVAGLALPALVALVFSWLPGTFRSLPDPAPLARYVDANTEAGDSIWIWGSFPEVYWAADRPPGGAMVHSDFVTGLSGGRKPGPDTLIDATPTAEAEMLSSLRRNEPALVIDTSTAALRGYDAYPLTDFPALHDFLLANYTKTTKVDGATIWTRIPD